MSVSIADCTIRDGGYLLKKNSPPEFVTGIIKGLVDSGIDFVETGFLQNMVGDETIVYHNSQDMLKYLPVDKKRTEFLGFCDNSRYSSENLDTYSGNAFKWLRISFAKHEISEALEFCIKAMNKGYLVQFNPMDTISYSDDERESLIAKINIVRPACFSIVDTFGAMYLDDLERVFNQVDRLLNKDIKIGLHSHDNLGLSSALAEYMITMSEKKERDIIVDGSLFGMGRGAGNARTELLADYLNKKQNKKYDIPILLETIDKYITPLLGDIYWGYDLPMYVCGTTHAHVDNVYHLRDLYNCSVNDMYDVMSLLSPQQRTRYGTGYSKTDFSILDEVYKMRTKEVED